jgi:anti-sigma factor RsiW
MSHRRVRLQLEEYAEDKLSPGQTQAIERHLATCTRCNEYLRTIGWSRALMRVIKLKDNPEPSKGFARRLADHLESDRDVYLFWLPLRSMALKAIPVMALLAILLGAMAYRQVQSAASSLAEWEDPLLESYSEQREGLTEAIFSETIAQDPNRVVLTLMGEPSMGGKRENHDEPF